ncbi:MAG: hotdog fold thioesterase [Deltaproteobacteria bacterium]|jgi:1,4-dihydroxy-2-naphthoyl-CoA hydrolase|nr:hotdog fold thioesterase [Deltaproteobacteria bacterium]
MENIWKKEYTIKDLNDFSKNSIVGYLGIVFTKRDSDSLNATMPVDKRTIQPLGILHGGASVVLAETLGSTASYMTVNDPVYTVGLEINANHVRSADKGIVTGTAKPVHLGNTTQVWDISIKNEKDQFICISRLTMAVLQSKR